MFADDFQTIRTSAERDSSTIVHRSRFPENGHVAAMKRRTFFA